MGLVKHWEELVSTLVRTPQSTGGLDSLQGVAQRYANA
jgi:hypothetical protein